MAPPRRPRAAWATKAGAQAPPEPDAAAQKDSGLPLQPPPPPRAAAAHRPAAAWKEAATGGADAAEAAAPWPPRLQRRLRVPRGAQFLAQVEDPLDWRHRSGRYLYVVVGWDDGAGRYEAWEATGLHTRLFGEPELLAGLEEASPRHDAVAWWSDGERGPLPALERRPI